MNAFISTARDRSENVTESSTMASVLDQLSNTYAEIVDSGDPRGNKYPLVSTPIPMIVTMGLYITFTKVAPRYFEKKKALCIKPLIVVYNFFMVLLSAYMFKEFLISAYLANYNITCQPMDYSFSPLTLRMVQACWLFYISKTIELADTVFLVVRKKGDLSFLHVFHHSSVLFNQWTFIKYIPNGHGFFQAICNCFVHTIMYLYYFMACFPALKKYLWWKKYLTMLQMVQFVLIIAHVFAGIYVDCNYPMFPAFLALFECSVLLILFGNYYIQAYPKKRKADQMKISKKE